MNIYQRLLHDFLTGLDGQTFAIGRGMGLVLFLVGVLLPVAIAIFAGITQHPSLPDWGVFLGACAAYWAGLAGAVWGLIRGTNSTEPEA